MIYIKKFFSGEMALNELITHEYDIEHINEGFSDLERGKVGRALIKMGKWDKSVFRIFNYIIFFSPPFFILITSSSNDKYSSIFI